MEESLDLELFGLKSWRGLFYPIMISKQMRLPMSNPVSIKLYPLFTEPL